MTVTKSVIAENSAVTLLARVRDSDGDYLTQADVSALTCRIYDRDTGDEVLPAPTLVIADCIYDVLQTDDRWTTDADGYNFAAGLAGDCFPSGNTTYRVEIRVTPVDGDPFYVLWDLETLNVFSE